jgi:hypothetical protein
LGPDGQGEEDGGGNDFMLGTTQAVSLAKFSGANVRSATGFGYKAKVAPQADVK